MAAIADTGLIPIPPIVNEAVRSYDPGGRDVFTGTMADAVMAHRHEHALGRSQMMYWQQSRGQRSVE